MGWQVGTSYVSSPGANWEVGTTTPAPSFSIQQAGTYRHGSLCVLQVVGADGAYSIKWSPTNDPDHADAITLSVMGSSLDANGDGTITVTAARGTVRYGTAGWVWLVQGVESSGLPVTLLAETNKQHVILATPFADPSLRLSAIPDLAATDQVIWWGAWPYGDVEVFDDAAFVTDGTVETFQVEAHIQPGGYTATSTQYVSYSLYTGDIASLVTGASGYLQFRPAPVSFDGAAAGFVTSADGTLTYRELLFSYTGTALGQATVAGGTLAQSFTQYTYAGTAGGFVAQAAGTLAQHSPRHGWNGASVGFVTTAAGTHVNYEQPPGLQAPGAKWRVAYLPSVLNLRPWLDYFPVQTVVAPSRRGSYDWDGALVVTTIDNTTNLRPWVHYIPVYEIGARRWKFNDDGYIPIVESD